MEPYTDLELAIMLAVQYHKDQVDKAGRPYILHPLSVMQILLNEGCTDEETLSVAVLHDVIEDCNATVEELMAKGVSRIGAATIEVLSKRKDEKYWDYIDRVKVDSIARKVKLADLKNNSELERLYQTGDKEFASIAGRYAKAYYLLREEESK